MRKLILLFSLVTLTVILFSCKTEEKNEFLGDGTPFFEVQEIFPDERFPNVVVATDGTVLATWGNKNMRVRRSEDGGKTWGPEITVANPGFQGGGTTVDEKSGDILFFIEETHPVSPLKVYRSKDHGKTWRKIILRFYPTVWGIFPPCT
jgi:sialidase-1